MPFHHHHLAQPNPKQKRAETTGLRAKIFLDDQQSYRGEWLHNEKHGRGTLTHRGNQCFYEGEFRHDKRNGYGRLTRRNERGEWQRVYVGQWRDDRWHGVGTNYLSEISFYQGEFCDDQRHGWGLFVEENGDL